MTIAGNSIHFQGSNKNEWYGAPLCCRLEQTQGSYAARSPIVRSRIMLRRHPPSS